MDALLVPQRAVTELQGTYQVAIVGPDNKAHIQPVKMGRRVDHEWIVEEGVESRATNYRRRSAESARRRAW